MKQFAPALKAEVYLIAAKPGEIKTRDGLVMKPHKTFREVPRLGSRRFVKALCSWPRLIAGWI